MIFRRRSAGRHSRRLGRSSFECPCVPNEWLPSIKCRDSSPISSKHRLSNDVPSSASASASAAISAAMYAAASSSFPLLPVPPPCSTPRASLLLATVFVELLTALFRDRSTPSSSSQSSQESPESPCRTSRVAPTPFPPNPTPLAAPTLAPFPVPRAVPAEPLASASAPAPAPAPDRLALPLRAGACDTSLCRVCHRSVSRRFTISSDRTTTLRSWATLEAKNTFVRGKQVEGGHKRGHER